MSMTVKKNKKLLYPKKDTETVVPEQVKRTLYINTMLKDSIFFSCMHF